MCRLLLGFSSTGGVEQAFRPAVEMENLSALATDVPQGLKPAGDITFNAGLKPCSTLSVTNSLLNSLDDRCIGHAAALAHGLQAVASA